MGSIRTDELLVAGKFLLRCGPLVTTVEGTAGPVSCPGRPGSIPETWLSPHSESVPHTVPNSVAFFGQVYFIL